MEKTQPKVLKTVKSDDYKRFKYVTLRYHSDWRRTEWTYNTYGPTGWEFLFRISCLDIVSWVLRQSCPLTNITIFDRVSKRVQRMVT